MKKLITICLVMASAFVAQAQNKITGIKDDFPRGVPYYDKVNFEITYQVVEKNGTIRVNLSNPKIFVHPDSNYNVDGISYSKQDLGLASWPQTQKPVRFGVSLNVQYPGGSVNHMFSCTESGICHDNNDYILRSVENTSNYKPSDFTVSYNGEMTYDPQSDGDVDRRIVSKKNSSNSNSTSGSEVNNTIIEQSNPTYTKQEITNQVVTGVAGLAGELLNDWNANRERKEKIRDAEYKAKISDEYDAKTNKFNTQFLPLMSKAEQGDENARMILFFASRGFGREYLVRDRMRWLEEASANGNMDALLVKAFNEGLENAIPKFEKLADMGNVDAMIFLGFWYNGKPDKSGQYSLPSGENPQKALEFYTRAADKGSPNAMYMLGMIYKYGNTTNDRYSKRIQVSYKDIIKLDEEIAFGWFAQSLQPNYVESIFSKGNYLGSCFDKNAYLEMAKIFREGRVVEKNKVRAKELEELYREYVNTQKFN